MLPKSFRLSLKRDFENIFTTGRSYQGKFFRFKILKNNFKSSRFAVVVSLRVSKKAVVRNKIRRRAWSVINSLPYVFNNKLDIILIALPEATKASFFDLRLEITNFFTKKFL